MVKQGIPRKIRHFSSACTEEELDLIRLTAAALKLTPSALVRMLVLKEYNSLVQNKYFANLDLRSEEVNHA
jgi:hypothetical protein